MHTGHKRDPDFGQSYAHRAMMCLRFQADLCTPGSDMPQISGRLMHTGQWYALDLRQTYAHRAMLCPRFQADLCTPGNGMPRISGRLLHTRNDMIQNPLIPSENKNESSSKPDYTSHYLTITFFPPLEIYRPGRRLASPFTRRPRRS